MITLEMHIKRFDLTARAHAQILREINRNVSKRQLYERVPKHFEETAYGEYGAQPRSGTYNKRKQRKKGHKRPNVYTGRLKRSVINRAKITATQNGTKLTMRGTTRSRLQEWQRREIAAVTEAEKTLERKRMAREYKKWATSERYARKRTRRKK